MQMLVIHRAQSTDGKGGWIGGGGMVERKREDARGKEGREKEDDGLL